MARKKEFQYLSPLSRHFLFNPPLTHGDFGLEMANSSPELQAEFSRCLHYLRSVSGRMFPIEDSQTLRQQVDGYSLPPLFFTDYLIITSVKIAIANFRSWIQGSFEKLSFFDGQEDSFHFTQGYPLEFFQWYWQFYPLDQGRSLVFWADANQAYIKLFGRFACKDTKIYATFDQEDFHRYCYLSFLFELWSFELKENQQKLIQVLINYVYSLISDLNFFTEVYEGSSLKSIPKPVFENDVRHLAMLGKFKPFSFLDCSQVVNSIASLLDKPSDTSKFGLFHAFLQRDPSGAKPISNLEGLFSHYLVNIAMYSFVKDAPLDFTYLFFNTWATWVPVYYRYQRYLQRRIIVDFAEHFPGALERESSADWEFSCTDADFFISWYHSFYYSPESERSPDSDQFRLSEPSYLERKKASYANLLGLNSLEPLEMPFDRISPLYHRTGHPELLAQFVRKNEVVLSYPLEFKKIETFKSSDQGVMDFSSYIYKILSGVHDLRLNSDEKPKVLGSFLTFPTEISQHILYRMLGDEPPISS